MSDDDEDSDETISFSVYVERSDTSDPYKGAEVVVIYPFTNQSAYTDETGHAYFERPKPMMWSFIKGTIYVRGWDGEMEVGEYDIRDGAGFSTAYP